MSAPEIVVVDYHKGNLSSVVRSVAAVGGDVGISDDPAVIARATGIIMPGVGSFEDAMSYLRSSGEADAVIDAIRRGVPYLGICLGLHLPFSRGSERNGDKCWGGEWVPGLGILEGSVTRLESSRLKVPHVGWNQIHLTGLGRACPLFVDVPEGANVYFTHSYAVQEGDAEAITSAVTHYTRTFPAAIWDDNIFGLQFHPEKSSATGLRILSNFVKYVRG